MEDLPQTWDPLYDFFKEVQKKLRAQGMRRVYAMGFQLAKGYPIGFGRAQGDAWAGYPAVSEQQEPVMNSFYDHHKDSIRFNYRCFDRILLNGLIQPFQQPERVVGFFDVYRHLYPVSRDILRGAAEQFQLWVKEQAGEWNVPIVDAPKGRRDEFVDPYFKGARPDQIVVILKAREPADH